MRSRNKASREELLLLSDLNYTEAWREMTRLCGGVSLEEDGALFTAGPHPHPMINNCFRTRESADPRAFLERAVDFYGSRGHGFSLILREHVDDSDLEAVAEKAELIRVVAPPAMILEQRVPDESPPAGVTLKQVVDAQGLADFTETAIQAWATYQLPADGIRLVFARQESLLLPHIVAVVAYDEGVPLASAMVLVTHGVAGVYWVSTTPAARGRGLANLCTRWVTNEGFERGARIASLQASPMGEGVYRRMGYRTISRYPLWVKTPPAEH